MALTPEEKVKIRMHMGYLNIQQVYTFVLGVPSPVETQFLIEGAMNHVLDEALPEIRRHVQILDSIEQQGIDDHELLAVSEVGEIKVRPDEHGSLTERYRWWQNSLGNLLGVNPNPWDRRSRSGVNVPVL